MTLEPCAHHGRTPPCAEAVVAAGIARVVGGLTDPDDRVAGEGYGLLRGRGSRWRRTSCPTCAGSAHRGHILRVTEGRPMVTLKIAQTADGQAAGGAHDRRLAITGLAANSRTHVMRAMHEAIMVGIGTALGRRSADDRAPARLRPETFAGRARRPARPAFAFAPRRFGAREIPALVLCGEEADAERRAALQEQGVEIETCALDAAGRLDLRAALQIAGDARDHAGVFRRRPARRRRA